MTRRKNQVFLLLLTGALISGDLFVRADTPPSEQTSAQQAAAPLAGEPEKEVAKPIGFSPGPMGLPLSALPAKHYVASTRVIIAVSDDNKRIFGYSETAPRWAAYDLDEPLDRGESPIVSTDVGVVVTKSVCVAYSSQQGRWDAVRLDNETVTPIVSTSYAQLHTKKADYVFKNAWGRWYSAEDILAGRVTGKFSASSQRDRGGSDVTPFFGESGRRDDTAEGGIEATIGSGESVSNLRKRYEDAEAAVRDFVKELRGTDTASDASGEGNEVVVISADWGSTGRRLRPIIKRLQDEGMPIRIVDISEFKGTPPIQAFPTFIAYSGGEEVGRRVGVQTYEELRGWITNKRLFNKDTQTRAKFLLFTASWSAGSRQLAPHVKQLAAEGVQISEIDAEQHPDDLAKYDVTAIPTCIVLLDGREVDRRVEHIDSEVLRELATKLKKSSDRAAIPIRLLFDPKQTSLAALLPVLKRLQDAGLKEISTEAPSAEKWTQYKFDSPVKAALLGGGYNEVFRTSGELDDVEIDRFVSKLGIPAAVEQLHSSEAAVVAPSDREKLRSKIAVAFEFRQQLLKAELQDSQRHLLMLRQFLDERDSVAKQVVDQRLSQLIGEGRSEK